MHCHALCTKLGNVDTDNNGSVDMNILSIYNIDKRLIIDNAPGQGLIQHGPACFPVLKNSPAQNLTPQPKVDNYQVEVTPPACLLTTNKKKK